MRVTGGELGFVHVSAGDPWLSAPGSRAASAEARPPPVRRDEGCRSRVIPGLEAEPPLMRTPPPRLAQQVLDIVAAGWVLKHNKGATTK